MSDINYNNYNKTNLTENHYEDYNGFNNVTKLNNHVITTKSANSIGICDLNSNCSSIELDLSKIKNNKFNPVDTEPLDNGLNINTTQSNFLISKPNQQIVQSSISINNVPDNINIQDNTKERFEIFNLNSDTIIIFILVVLLIIYLIKRKK